MIEKFKIKNDKNRTKVLQYLKKSKIDLTKFKMQDFRDYPGGILLIDDKKRKIVIYNDYLEGKIKEIYNNFNGEKKELLNNLWEEYSLEGMYRGEVSRIKKDKVGNVEYYRYKINEKGKTSIIHRSKKFLEKDETYDILEYLNNEIIMMQEQRIKNNK